MTQAEPCAMCGRGAPTTRHHLIPRKLHKRLKKKGVEEERLQETVPLCRACHSTVHQTFSEKELAGEYNTLEAILSDERVAKWRDWLAGKPDGFKPKLRGWKAASGR
ncbi:HNH endonuclease [Desulfohalovibrio reitneri]|uniref:HNH endonuclease n=1 Tax=Desulfohalovibrio reitneri TaxID=1307759 RepID=UPI0004A6D4D9|nr:HNH endonuclease [Desulfohalovibrio reitneri]